MGALSLGRNAPLKAGRRFSSLNGLAAAMAALSFISPAGPSKMLGVAVRRDDDALEMPPPRPLFAVARRCESAPAGIGGGKAVRERGVGAGAWAVAWARFSGTT